MTIKQIAIAIVAMSMFYAGWVTFNDEDTIGHELLVVTARGQQ